MDSMLRMSDRTIDTDPVEEKQLALRYLLDAWEEAAYEGVDRDCLATAAIFAALSELITLLAPRAFVGVGTFAWKKLQEIDVRPADVPCVQVLHPSPASPRANQDWVGEVLAVLRPAGLWP